MGKPGHTPGPWFVDREFSGNVSATHNRQLAVMVAQNGNEDERRANARLVAAAPSMLQTLERIRDLDPDATIRDLAEDAIALAEGK